MNFTTSHLVICIFNSYKYSQITLQNRTNASQPLAILLCHLTMISPCFCCRINQATEKYAGVLEIQGKLIYSQMFRRYY